MATLHIARRLALHPLALAASLSLLPWPAAQAATRYWSCAGTVNWTSTSCWKLSDGTATTPPVAGDDVHLLRGAAGTATVLYGIDPGVEFGAVLMATRSNAGALALNVNDGAAHLRAVTLTLQVGNGTGDGTNAGSTTLQQSAGKVTVHELQLRGPSADTSPNAKASYLLSGGTLSTGSSFIGRSVDRVSAVFNQTGGSHLVQGQLWLNSSKSSSYQLSGANSLLDAGSLLLGGSSSFAQSAGLLKTGTMELYGSLTRTGGSSQVSGGVTADEQALVSTSGGTLQAGSLSVLNTASWTHGGTSQLTVAGELLVSGLPAASFVLNGGTVQSAKTSVGRIPASSGSFLQQAGTHTVTGELTLNGNGINGTAPLYRLQGGTLTAGSVRVGDADGGRFEQTGGTLSAGSFSAGAQATSSGQALLVQGTLTSTGLVLGAAGQGSFTQQGGNHTTGNLVLAQATGSKGQLALQGGNLTAGTLVVGDAGQGQVDQTAGRLQAGTVEIGRAAGGQGQYTLAGGQLLAGTLAVGAGGQGRLVQSGGSAVISGATLVGGATGGELRLAGGGWQSGSLAVQANGRLVFDGGSLLTGSLASDGTLLVSKNTGSAAQIALGSRSTTVVDAVFTSAGTLTLARNLVNEHAITGSGTLVNNGTLQGQGSIQAKLSNAGLVQSRGGDLTLAGPQVINDGMLRNGIGSNLFITAATAVNNGRVEVQSGGAVVFDANLAIQADRTARLLGGTLAAPQVTVASGGQLSGFGTVVGNLRNFGRTDFFGPTQVVGNLVNEASGELLVRNEQTLVTGDLVNFGTLRTVQGKVVYEGSFTNLGSYISDPSDNHFNQLVVGSQGHLEGGAGDRFIIGGSFLNHSTQAQLWDTRGASLVLAGPGDKLVTLAGADRGNRADGGLDNYAWGDLQLTDGARLELGDGNAEAGAALYVGGIGGVQTDGLQALNITGHGFNIYYDASLAANAYLHGRSYGLADGGTLSALAPVPEPETWALMLSGLVALGLLAGRRPTRP